MNETSINPLPIDDSVDYYRGYLKTVKIRFQQTLNAHKALFRTDANGLWELFHHNLPVKYQQFYNCRTCRHFFERYAGLAYVDDSGRLQPAMWSEEDTPKIFALSENQLNTRIRQSDIVGVFLTDAENGVLGTPVAGGWEHFSVNCQDRLKPANKILTAFQAMAEKTEDFKNVCEALQRLSEKYLQVAVTLLQSDALYRSQNVLGPAQWLLKVAKFYSTNWNISRRNNLLWKAVAEAPAGFCHPRSSMIWTLLEDLEEGRSLEEAKARFDRKMNPLQYQRPQAAPKAGTIVQAEKIVEQLKSAGSLRRRFASLEDIQTIWRSQEQPQPTGKGVFGNIKPKGRAESTVVGQIDVGTITWAKFYRDVVPTADQLQVLIKAWPTKQYWGVYLTAAEPDSPILFRWNNHVSWYLPSGGAAGNRYGVLAGYRKVSALSLQPSMWGGSSRYTSKGVLFVVDGAEETITDNCSIFPETLKGEYHGIRSVIEQYSRQTPIEKIDKPHVAGLILQNTQKRYDQPIDVLATVNGVVTHYTIDRWE